MEEKQLHNARTTEQVKETNERSKKMHKLLKEIKYSPNRQEAIKAKLLSGVYQQLLESEKRLVDQFLDECHPPHKTDGFHGKMALWIGFFGGIPSMLAFFFGVETVKDLMILLLNRLPSWHWNLAVGLLLYVIFIHPLIMVLRGVLIHRMLNWFRFFER